MQNIWIDTDKCTGCGDCVNLCPHRVLALQFVADKNRKIAVLNVPRRCADCESCVDVCPVQAITGYKL